MKLLKVLSRMLDYPSKELQLNTDALADIVSEAKEISPDMRKNLLSFLTDLERSDLMDLQEIYDGMFERGRATSLLLFEHVHGESRDRGQAMVDLMSVYEKAGFNITVRELPDYIPLYLEYLSTCDDLDARVGLADVSHIFALLSARLKQRDSKYHHVIDSLLMISGVDISQPEVSEKVAKEERDDSLEALDKVWEEEMISFMADKDTGACDASTARQFPLAGEMLEELGNEAPQPVTVQWTDAGKKHINANSEQ